MRRFLKKSIGVILTICVLVSCCGVLVSADTSNARSDGPLSNGVYSLQNVGSEKYMSADSAYNEGIIEQISMRQQGHSERSQLFKITCLGVYNGEPCYSIRPMTDSYCVLGASNPEYEDIVKMYGISSIDDYNILGEENVWYIIPDGEHYKLKNKYFGEAYNEIFECDVYDDNSFLCAYDDEDYAPLQIGFVDESTENYDKWIIRPYTQELERIKITNPVSRVLSGSTYNFDAIAYSTKIGANGPLTFSVESLGGNATINSYTGVCNMISPGAIQIVLTYGCISRRYNVYIESTEANFDSTKEYYIMNISKGSDISSEEDDEYIYINAKYTPAATKFSNDLEENVRAEDVKWKIERYVDSNGEASFTIKRGTSDYLTLCGNYEGAAINFTAISETPTNNQLWKFEKVSDYSYIIKSKISENTNYVLTGIPVSGANPSLIASQYNSVQNYIYQWKIYEVGDDIALLSIKNDTHDHIKGLSQTLPHLRNLGYGGFDFIDIQISSSQEAELNQNSIKNQIISKMENSRVFISRSHGNYDANGTYLGLWSQDGNVITALHATDIYDYTNKKTIITLSKCDIALFVACYTAKEGGYILPDAAVRSGADCAIGFKESITCGAASDWTREFLKLYEAEYTSNYIDFAIISSNASDIVNEYERYREIDDTHLNTYSVFLSDAQ